ncbi:MAG: helix-turn-helix transcriptional regulator [Candidatus Dormibacteraceae bacterium]
MGGEERRSGAVVAIRARRQAGRESEVLRAFRQFVPLLQATLGARAEVVLHDLSRLPNSIVAISGDITGRRIGGLATDVLFDLLREGGESSLINYRTESPDGRPLRSSTLLIRDGSARVVGALCVNTDLSDWLQMKDVVDGLFGEAQSCWPAPETLARAADARMPAGERFASNVDDLASYLVGRAIADQGIAVELMQKRHKLAVVRALEQNGLFAIRDAVPLAARALQVSRFTIYNYLKEPNGGPPRAHHRGSRARA